MEDIVKTLILITTAIVGIWGSLAKLRTPTNQISRHGWLCIIVIIITSAISGYLQSKSSKKDDLRDRTLLETNNTLLREANRNLSLISPFTLTIELKPDLKLKTISAFVKQIEDDTFTIKYRKRFILENSIGSVPLPKNVSKANAALLESVCSQTVTILFFKEKSAAESFIASNSPLEKSNSDLKLSIDNPCRLSDIAYKTESLGLSEKQNHLATTIIHGKLVDLTFRFEPVTFSGNSLEWTGNGGIIAIPDLTNSTMIITLHNSSIDFKPGFTNEEVGKLRRNTQLSELTIKFSNGILMAFNTNNLKEYKNSKQEPYYAFTFPSSLEKIILATKQSPNKRFDKIESLLKEAENPARL